MKVRISQNFACFKFKHWPLMSTLLTKPMQCHKACDSRMKNTSNFDWMVGEKKYELKHRRNNYGPMIAAVTELWTELQNWQKQNLLFNTKITEFTMIWLLFFVKRGTSNCTVGKKSWQKRDCSLCCIFLIRHQRKQRTTRLQSSRCVTYMGLPTPLHGHYINSVGIWCCRG